MNYYKQTDTGRVYQVIGRMDNKIMIVDPLDLKEYKTTQYIDADEFNAHYKQIKDNGK